MGPNTQIERNNIITYTLSFGYRYQITPTVNLKKKIKIVNENFESLFIVVG